MWRACISAPLAALWLGAALRSWKLQEPASCVAINGALATLAVFTGIDRKSLWLPVLPVLLLTAFWVNYGRLQVLHGYRIPENIAKFDLIPMAVTSSMMALWHEGYASGLLPGWARLLLAEAYTLSKWFVIQTDHHVRQPHGFCESTLPSLLIHHIMGTVLPLVLFRAGKQPSSQTQASSGASDSDRPQATGMAACTGNTAQKQPNRTQFADAPPAKGNPVLKPGSNLSTRQSTGRLLWQRLLRGLRRRPTMDLPDQYASTLGRHLPVQVATQHAFLWPSHMAHTGMTWTPATVSASVLHLSAHAFASWATLTAVDFLLPRAMQITVKINTHHSPHIVSTLKLNDLAQQLQDLMSQTVANTGSRLQVLDAAVRYGCILISMDAYQAPTGNSSAAPTGSGSVSRDEVLQLARELLPSLLSQLGLPDKGPDLEQLDDSWQLRLQVGPHLVTAACDRATLEWQFEVVDAPAEQLSDMPSIHLAQPCPATVQPSTDHAAPDGQHLVSFTVRCAGVVGPVQGSDPDATNQPQASSQSALKLWVQSQGQYLKTMSVTRQPSQPDLLHVTVQLPSTALSRHHQPGGPVARLQLLDVGLWTAADVRLSSTPLLLDVVQHLHPAVASGSIRNWGWWGGLDAHRVPQLLQELAHMTALTAQQSATNAGLGNSAQQHEQLMQNLAAWLKVVQQAAPSTCCDMVGNTDSITHSIAPQQLAATAQALLRYTAACGMRTTHAVVKAQCTAVTSRCHTAKLRALTHIGDCRVCMVAHYQRLRQHLWQAQFVLGLVLCLGSYAAFQAVGFTTPPMFSWTSHLLLAVRAAATVAHLTAQAPHSRMPAAPHTQQTVLTALQLVTWLLHLFMDAGFALGYVQIPAAKCRTAALAPYIATHSAFSVIVQQVALWGLVPDSLVRGLVVTETLMHVQAFWSCPGISSACRLWFVASTVIMPWLLHWYWWQSLRRAEAKAGRGMLSRVPSTQERSAPVKAGAAKSHTD